MKTNNSDDNIKLTQYSHGAGCGCKLSPSVLNEVLLKFKKELPALSKQNPTQRLLVGTEHGDDAAVYQLDDQNAIISTTDFFMPIVDDAFTFGRIAATNALSDIYAMGGRPLMAISILGWPINKLSAQLAGTVIEGAQSVCNESGITIAGGHSIDSPEPIFGLAVTGHIHPNTILTNSNAQSGDLIYLTKPLGIGILTTAQKQQKLKPEHSNLAIDWMCKSNQIGFELAQSGDLHAMTDVTGFGLAGHLLEVCRASGLSAQINLNSIPIIEFVSSYLQQGCVPGGTKRNFESYGNEIHGYLPNESRDILCDPQTSGGLLLFVNPNKLNEVEALLKSKSIIATPIGSMYKNSKAEITVVK